MRVLYLYLVQYVVSRITVQEVQDCSTDSCTRRLFLCYTGTVLVQVQVLVPVQAVPGTCCSQHFLYHFFPTYILKRHGRTTNVTFRPTYFSHRTLSNLLSMQRMMVQCTTKANTINVGGASAFLRNLPVPRGFSNKGQSKGRLFSTADPEGSKRGVDAVNLLPTYLADARACPKDSLQLGVAENQMLEDLLVPALSEFGKTDPAFAADCIYYQPTHGRPELRDAMANYLQRLLKLPKSLDQDGIVMGAGCNAVLENLCFCLAERGDAVLIPTPYYAAFEFDLVARAGKILIEDRYGRMMFAMVNSSLYLLLFVFFYSDRSFDCSCLHV